MNSVSCGAAGDCAAGGYYKDGSGHSQAFVVSETNGVWGHAVKVPGTAALNSGGTPRELGLVCRGRATARPAATTRTAPATSRRSW